MKKILLLPYLLLLMTATAQNYNLFNPNNVTGFINSSGFINVIKVDSIHIQNNDTIYILTPGIYDITGFERELLSADAPSWIGDKIIKRTDGTYIFYMPVFIKDFEEDSFGFIECFINVRSIVKRQFFCFDQDSVFIDFLKQDTLTINMCLDTVKVFNIKRKNSSDSIFIVGKNSGILRIPMSFFPNNYHLNHYNNIGSTVQKKYVLIKKAELLDFNIGDKIHIKSLNSNYPFSIFYKTINCISKNISINSDTITYNFKINQYNCINYFGTKDTIITSKDSILIIPNPNEPFTTSYPNETFFFNNYFGDYSFGAYTLKQTPLAYNNRRVYCFRTATILDSVKKIGGGGCLRTYYIEGIGEIKEYSTGNYPYNSYSDEIIYFKKGKEEWGNAFNPSSIDESEIIHKQILYPNPSNGHFDVNFQQINSSELNLEIYDLHGHLLEKVKAGKFDNFNSINLSNLDNGIYLVKISSSNTQYYQKITIIK